MVELVFTDDAIRQVDLEPYLWGAVLEQVRDPKFFAKFRIDRASGTIVWPNGADIDPDVLYLGLKPAAGETPARYLTAPLRHSGRV